MPDPIIIGEDADVRVIQLGTDAGFPGAKRSPESILALTIASGPADFMLAMDRSEAQQLAVLLADAARGGGE